MIGRPNLEFIASQFEDTHAVDSRHPIHVEKLAQRRLVCGKITIIAGW
jgi:hypothetical protein